MVGHAALLVVVCFASWETPLFRANAWEKGGKGLIAMQWMAINRPEASSSRVGVAQAQWGWARQLLEKILPRSGFLRSVTVLAGGTAVGQGLTIAASPILTRLYSPADFGALALYASLLATISIIASLRYELAIPIAAEDETAANLFVLCIVSVLGVGAVSGLAVWLAGDKLVAWMNAPALRPYLWLLPIGIVGSGIYKSANYWALRYSAFGRVARTKLAQSLAQVVVQIAGGLLFKGPLGLIAGQIVGQSGGSTSLLAMAWRTEKSVFKRVTFSKVCLAAGRFVRFPLYSSWAGVLNTLSVHVPTVVLAVAFGPTTVGLYSLSSRILQAPMKLMGQAIGQVFFSTAAVARREGRMAEVTLEAYTKLVEIGLPAILLLAVAMPEVFSVVFGAEWRVAGTYSQWLAPWLFLVFVASPLSTLSSVLERQGGELIFQVVLLVTRLLGLGAGVILRDALTAVALYGLASTVCWFGYMIWTIQISGNSHVSGLRVLAREAFAAVPVVLPVLMATWWFDQAFPVVVVAMACGGFLSLKILRIMRGERSYSQ